MRSRVIMPLLVGVTAVAFLGKIERGGRESGHALQGDEVALFKGVGVIGE